ncbi:MAG: GreA/GreB family elongation factor [Burkholderiaceae bacterium]|nr:GreA/GreB family elongation factor [Burkholderiaceae bacterium]
MPSSHVSPVRLLNELDHLRLRRLVPPRGATGPLAGLLDMADLVLPQDMPPDVATMRSRLLLETLPGGEQRTYTLSYPEEADPARGDLSVLSPAGASLLGLTVGSEARWQSLDGQHHAVRLLDILYQPEAAGAWAR